jgi:hypothetical protein
MAKIIPIDTPLNRRAALAGGLAALAGTAVAAGPSAFSLAGEDAELFKLEAEIAVLNRAAQEIREQSIEPADAAWHALARTDWEAACAFGLSSGREEAVERIVAVDAKADRLFERLMAIPATTQAGRAAKVRGLLVDWRRFGRQCLRSETGSPSKSESWRAKPRISRVLCARAQKRELGGNGWWRTQSARTGLQGQFIGRSGGDGRLTRAIARSTEVVHHLPGP